MHQSFVLNDCTSCFERRIPVLESGREESMILAGIQTTWTGIGFGTSQLLTKYQNDIFVISMVQE